MGAFLRTAALSVVGMVATFAMRKMITSIQNQAEKVRAQGDQQRTTSQARTMKTLKQDPVTGVYYAED